MPWQSVDPDSVAPEHSGATPLSRPLAVLVLWPHQSLTGPGFVWFIGATAGLLAIPLVPFIGTTAAWVLLAFLLAALAGIWVALQSNRRARSTREELTLWPDLIRICREDPHRPPRLWEANPHWVELRLRHVGGPVPQYLTLRGAGREVELGAFLTGDERRALHDTVARLIADSLSGPVNHLASPLP